MKRTMLSIFVAAMGATAPSAALAVDCITDVMVVGGENKSVTNSYVAQGWKVIGQDLNAGAGGDYVFLLYKSADSASVSNGFITGFYIKTGAVTNELTHVGCGYHLAPCAGDDDFVNGNGDLNSNTDKPGDVIHLYYTKSVQPGNRVVTGITFNTTQSGAVGKNGGTTSYDLNAGASGDYIYMHVTTGELPYAPPVSYLDPTDPEHPEKICHGYTFVTNQTTLDSGWYVVAGTVTYNGGLMDDGRITISGDVNLILTDGAELVANYGITVDMNDSITNRLTIWAQSTNAIAGKLTAWGGQYEAGIGGGNYGAGGMVTVNGGTVMANGGISGAGIGGGQYGAGGMVTVNGGMVEVKGGIGGAGIGGGWYGDCGAVTVNGGTVTANGNYGGAGIGGGGWGSVGAVTVNGGTVTAKGDANGAAIGAGVNGTDGSLSIDGMKVGYVDGNGNVASWAAPGDRDGYCRNGESKTVRIEVCDPHEYDGTGCRWCGAVFSITANVSGYEGAYDGEGHGVTVAVTDPADGATVRYSVGGALGESTLPAWSEEAPLFTNVCDVTVRVEIAAPNYATVTNSVAVKITKAKNAWISEPSISGWTYGEAASVPQMGAAKFGTVEVGYGATGTALPSAPGSYVATFTVPETANYGGLTKEIPFTIEPEPTPEPVKEDFFAGTVDTQFAGKQALMGALCGADGNVAGSVTLKFGKKSKKGVVKVSASATVVVDGKVKKVGAKAASFKADECGKELTLDFKQPVGSMTVAAEGGRFTLRNGLYEMAGLAVDAKTGAKRDVKVGGSLADGAMAFKVDFNELPDVEGLLGFALPTNAPAYVSGGRKFDFGKAASPKYRKDKASGTYELTGFDDPAKPNLSGLKLTYTPKTGIFKGSFKVYATTGGDKPKLKKYTVNVVGFAVDGVGVGWATLKKPSAEWAMTVR